MFKQSRPRNRFGERWHIVAGCEIKAQNVRWLSNTLCSLLDILPERDTNDRTRRHDFSRWSKAPLKHSTMRQCNSSGSRISLVDLPPARQLPRPVHHSRPKTLPWSLHRYSRDTNIRLACSTQNIPCSPPKTERATTGDRTWHT